MREIVSPLSGIRSPFGARRNPLAAYRAGGFTPKLVAAFVDEFYGKEGRKSTFGGVLEPTATTNGTMVDSDGLLKWRPHNLLTDTVGLTTNWGTVSQGTGSLPTITRDYAAAPDGTMTAARLQCSRTSAGSGDRSYFRQIAIPTVIGSDVTEALWVKSTDGTPQTIQLFNSQENNAKLTETVGASWQRISLEYPVLLSTSGQFWIGLVGAETTDLTTDVLIWHPHVHRSDLGGMASDPDQPAGFETEVPTTGSSAAYLPRRGHHIYNGSTWVNEGVLIEPETRTNLLLNSGSLSTQSVTVSANPHTLHFTGTGSITLSGAHSATLSGTGTGEENRVSLTFTPSAGTLVVTVSGTVTNGQLEEGSTPSSYIPTTGSQVARAGEQLVLPHENISWPAGDELSIHIEGRMTYADTGIINETVFVRWAADSSNGIVLGIDTDGADTGQFKAYQAALGVADRVETAGDYFSPGVNVLFNVAARHGSTFINGAVDGVALTANTTPTTFPDLETTNLELAYSGGSMVIKEVSLWDVNITDAGTEDATDD